METDAKYEEEEEVKAKFSPVVIAGKQGVLVVTNMSLFFLSPAVAVEAAARDAATAAAGGGGEGSVTAGDSASHAAAPSDTGVSEKSRIDETGQKDGAVASTVEVGLHVWLQQWAATERSKKSAKARLTYTAAAPGGAVAAGAAAGGGGPAAAVTAGAPVQTVVLDFCGDRSRMDAACSLLQQQHALRRQHLLMLQVPPYLVPPAPSLRQLLLLFHSSRATRTLFKSPSVSSSSAAAATAAAGSSLTSSVGTAAAVGEKRGTTAEAAVAAAVAAVAGGVAAGAREQQRQRDIGGKAEEAVSATRKEKTEKLLHVCGDPSTSAGREASQTPPSVSPTVSGDGGGGASVSPSPAGAAAADDGYAPSSNQQQQHRLQILCDSSRNSSCSTTSHEPAKSSRIFPAVKREPGTAILGDNGVVVASSGISSTISTTSSISSSSSSRASGVAEEKAAQEKLLLKQRQQQQQQRERQQREIKRFEQQQLKEALMLQEEKEGETCLVEVQEREEQRQLQQRWRLEKQLLLNDTELRNLYTFLVGDPFEEDEEDRFLAIPVAPSSSFSSSFSSFSSSPAATTRQPTRAATAAGAGAGAGAGGGGGGGGGEEEAEGASIRRGGGASAVATGQTTTIRGGSTERGANTTTTTNSSSSTLTEEEKRRIAAAAAARNRPGRILSKNEFWRLHATELLAHASQAIPEAAAVSFLAKPPLALQEAGVCNGSSSSSSSAAAAAVAGEYDHALRTILREDPRLRDAYQQFVPTGKLTEEQFRDRLFQSNYLQEFLGLPRTRGEATATLSGGDCVNETDLGASLKLRHYESPMEPSPQDVLRLASPVEDLISTEAFRREGFGTGDGLNSLSGDLVDSSSRKKRKVAGDGIGGGEGGGREEEEVEDEDDLLGVGVAGSGRRLRNRLLERFNCHSTRLLLQQMLPPSAASVIGQRSASAAKAAAATVAAAAVVGGGGGAGAGGQGVGGGRGGDSQWRDERGGTEISTLNGSAAGGGGRSSSTTSSSSGSRAFLEGNSSDEGFFAAARRATHEELLLLAAQEKQLQLESRRTAAADEALSVFSAASAAATSHSHKDPKRMTQAVLFDGTLSEKEMAAVSELRLDDLTAAPPAQYQRLGVTRRQLYAAASRYSLSKKPPSSSYTSGTNISSPSFICSAVSGAPIDEQDTQNRDSRSGGQQFPPTYKASDRQEGKEKEKEKEEEARSQFATEEQQKAIALSERRSRILEQYIHTTATQVEGKLVSLDASLYRTGRYMFVYSTKLCQSEKAAQVAALEYDPMTVNAVRAQQSRIVELLQHFYTSAVPEEDKRTRIIHALDAVKYELEHTQEATFGPYTGAATKALCAPLFDQINAAKTHHNKLKKLLVDLRAQRKTTHHIMRHQHHGHTATASAPIPHAAARGARPAAAAGTVGQNFPRAPAAAATTSSALASPSAAAAALHASS